MSINVRESGHFLKFELALTSVQGIDLIAGGRKCGHKSREAPKSDNLYIALLVKVGH